MGNIETFQELIPSFSVHSLSGNGLLPWIKKYGTLQLSNLFLELSNDSDFSDRNVVISNVLFSHGPNYTIYNCSHSINIFEPFCVNVEALYSPFSPGSPLGTTFILRYFSPSRKIAILRHSSYLHTSLSRVRKNFSPNQQSSGFHSHWTSLGYVPSLKQSLWVENWDSTDWSTLFRVHPGFRAKVDSPIHRRYLMQERWNGCWEAISSASTDHMLYTVPVHGPVLPNTYMQIFKTFIAQLWHS